MPLTRCEVRTERPQPTIEHGEWNTRLIAECDSTEGATLLIQSLDKLQHLKSVAPGVYRTNYQPVYDAYRYIMDSVGATPRRPRPPRYGTWALILLLATYSFSMRFIGVIFWAILMIFMGGGTATNIVATAIWFRLANTEKYIKVLVAQTKN